MTDINRQLHEGDDLDLADHGNLHSEYLREMEKVAEIIAGWKNAHAEIVAENVKICATLDKVRVEKDERISSLTDRLDLSVDEFERIFHLTDNEEVRGICKRSQQIIFQTVPVIQERNRMEEQIAYLQNDNTERYAKIENLKALLVDWVEFSKDVMPSCAAGTDWLQILRNRTEKEVENKE